MGGGDAVAVGPLHQEEQDGPFSPGVQRLEHFEVAPSPLGHAVGEEGEPIFRQGDALDLDVGVPSVVGVAREPEVESRV